MTNPNRYSMPLQDRQHSDIPEHQDSPTNPTTMNPSSALLQDLLREKKASQHARRTSHRSDHTAYERQVQSSPIAPSAAGEASKSSDRRISGNTAPKEMGLREMEEYISKINKQNFDLKLELFHRRQRNEALEVKVLKVKELEDQNDELEARNDQFRQLNDDLLQELEKRDVAVGEAVALICDLEAKIDELENEQSNRVEAARSPTAAAPTLEAPNPHRTRPPVTPSPSHGTLDTAALTSKTTEDRTSTPSPDRAEKVKPSNSPRRSPSFLRDDKPSTNALRSLFQKNGELSPNGLAMAKPSMRSLRRTGSFFSQDEYPDAVDEDTFSLNPRRLSLLSESSFVSVYGKDKDKTTPSTAHRNATSASLTNGGDMLFTRTLSPQEGRIRSWIENKDYPASSSQRPVKSARPDTFSSIGELIESNQPIAKDMRPMISPTPSKKHHQRVPSQQLSSFAGPIFGPDVLPPTPGTMSTATLGGRSSNHSIAAERSLAGPSQHTTGSPVISNDRTYRNTYATRSMRSEAARGVSQVFPDDDTDIEMSEDERDFVAALPNTKDTFNYRDTMSGADNIQRPALASHVTNFMFDGEDLGAIRPARTVSYASLSRSRQSASLDLARSNGKVSNAGKDGPESGERTPSVREDAVSPVDSSKSPLRPLHSRSKSSHATAQTPTLNLASRLFRRTPSYHAPPPPPTQNQPGTNHNNTAPPPRSQVHVSTITPAETKLIPESKLRPPRPSSLYVRSASHQIPSSSSAAAAAAAAAAPADPRIPRISRPSADTRRVSFDVSQLEDMIAGAAARENGMQAAAPSPSPPPQQQQQQNKRLSVGAIGRSASLKIKEGFGRRK